MIVITVSLTLEDQLHLSRLTNSRRLVRVRHLAVQAQHICMEVGRRSWHRVHGEGVTGADRRPALEIGSRMPGDAWRLAQPLISQSIYNARHSSRAGAGA